MCQKCDKLSKKLKPSISFGKIKVYAHRLLNSQPIPMFDRATDAAIEIHLYHIMQKRTKKSR